MRCARVQLLRCDCECSRVRLRRQYQPSHSICQNQYEVECAAIAGWNINPEDAAAFAAAQQAANANEARAAAGLGDNREHFE